MSISELSDFREYVKHQDNLVVDTVKLRDSAQTYGKDTLGSDNWKATDVDSLPDRCLGGIACSMNQSVQSVAMPHQLLLPLNSCLGKPQGGCRTICKTPMLYRLTVRTDNSVRQWEKSCKTSFDCATVKSSALVAALERGVQAEMAFWLKEYFAAMFNDFSNCFDTLDISTLLQEAIFNAFPAGPMAFAMQQHLAPRVIQIKNNCSPPVEI